MGVVVFTVVGVTVPADQIGGWVSGSAVGMVLGGVTVLLLIGPGIALAGMLSAGGLSLTPLPFETLMLITNPAAFLILTGLVLLVGKGFNYLKSKIYINRTNGSI